MASDIMQFDWGSAATFTPTGGAAIDCSVVLNKDVDLQPSGLDAQVWERGTTIDALIAEIISEPNRGDVFTVASVDYTVQSVLSNDGRFVKVKVK